MDKLSHLSASTFSRMRQIADILGIPVSAFFRDTPGEEADTLMLMRFWAATMDAQGRRRILNLARQEAARCGYREEN